ncbi:SusC/RagA family TonB-linked outer membrane protein [Paraflavisolibacter sp. H34]|uniref:SusC/RagA family TonB-linked outer membrane protein n=1 Tax=Huijunlia imazamoxiresistens TaxID=3127457 RepID=UPI003017B990
MVKQTWGSSILRRSGASKRAGTRGLSVFFLLLGLQAAAHASGSDPAGAAAKEGWEHAPDYRFFQADTTIRGKVTNKQGEPLSGVSVVVKGTKNGTVTNGLGEFSLPGVHKNATLVVSNVGFVLQEFRLEPGQRTLSVTLQEEAGSLQDVVVTGFQRIDRSKFTGAATKLNIDQVKTDGVIDVSRMLEGRAAGVSVQNVSGTFGAAPKVRIRGATSITGENKPLWVIDGVVLEDIVNISNDQLSSGDPNTLLGSAVAGLNANDIESFDILKDAAATALYGARAMNGVIVITTKRGKVGKPVVNYTGNFTAQLKPSYNNYDIMNSADQMSVYAELERKGYLPVSDLAVAPNTGVYGKLADMLDSLKSDGTFAVENTPEARAAFLSRYARANTDWFDILFRNSLQQEHSLSISSGNDKAQSYFSTSFYNDNGWTLADKVRRYTANLRNNYTFSNRFSAGFIVTGSMRQQEAPGTINRRSNPTEGTYVRDFDINPFSYALNTSRALTAFDEAGEREFFRRNFAPFNILSEIENNFIKLNLLDAKIQGQATYKITPHLTYDFIGAMRYVKSSREHQVTENSNQAQAYRANYKQVVNDANPYLYRDPANPDDPKVVVLPYGGFYNRTEDQLSNYTFRNSLTFNQTFQEDHQVTALLGQETKYANRQNFSNTGFGYQYNNGGIPFVDYRIIKQALEENNQYYGMGNEYDRFVGFFANASYTYKSRYNISGTVRDDGSNRLGKSRSARWLPTWTVSGRWNVDREAFLKDQSTISYLTLRGSYGLNASYGSATNSTAVLRTQLTRRPFLSDQQVAIIIQDLENAGLTWEKKYEANIGTDIGLFRNRMNITVDAYKRNSFDLISLIKTGGIGGQVFKQANYADLKSHGVEVTVGGKPVSKRDWSWSANLTFGYNTNEITNQKNNPLVFDLVQAEGGARVGYPVRGLFSIPMAGLDSYGVARYNTGKGELTNNVYLQSDSIDYLKYEGSVDPTITGGLSNTFLYKDFTLSFLLTYQAGNKIRLTPAYRERYSDLDAMPGEFKNRWSLIGDEAYTNVPSIADLYKNFDLADAAAYPYNIYNYSTARVVDGSFVRLKTASLTYRLPGRLVQGMGLNALSVSLVSNNLWLIYSDKRLRGQDPEFFNTGGVAMPINKQFVFSLKVGI